MNSKYHVTFDFVSSVQISKLREHLRQHLSEISPQLGAVSNGGVHVVRVRTPNRTQPIEVTKLES